MRCGTPAAKRIAMPHDSASATTRVSVSASWDRVLSTHRANCSSNITTDDSPTAASYLAIGANSGAQENANDCTIGCMIPDKGGEFARSLAIASS
jgi:hypothetical protein